MDFADRFKFGVEWNYKTVTLFAVLLFLPNLLGMINVGTAIGFKIHFFQIAIFIAALIYGPFGGLLSGLIGSFYSAIIMNNPYIIIGNMILGFFAGYFCRKRFNTIVAVLLAFCIQLPWIVLTDFYLVGLSMPFIYSLILALLVSNILWAFIAHHSYKPIKNSLR
jgi:uncharacterized membrane protein